MKLIATALRPEAEPFISKLKLKRDLNVHSHEVFRNEDTALIVTGIGAVRSAIGTTLILERYGSPSSLIMNIGVAAGPETSPCGSMYSIHSISSFTTSYSSFSTSYYPEMVVQTHIPEAALITVENPVSECPNDWPSNTLSDMEGIGFCQAAFTFCNPERILVLKVISDHFSPRSLSRESIRGAILANVDSALSILQSLHEVDRAYSSSPLPAQEENYLHLLAESLKLTTAQRAQLFKHAIRKWALEPKEYHQLRDLVVLPPANSQQRRQSFQQVLDVLSPS
ncbi:MAG: hypothetical protein KDD60_05010 [Bdellovibrionales bacterium]|nr:hypothetical protein [Bdellovibrionales bacterium]